MFTASITVDQVIDALANFLQPFLMIEGVPIEIIRAQSNRTPSPLGNFAVLTEMGQYELETPEINYSEINGSATVNNPTKVAIQLDLYGRKAGDFARAILSVFRSEYTVSQFPDGISSLYCSNALQAPFITGEMQYQDRWTFTIYLQYNATIVIPQDFPDELGINIFENVDTEINY